MERFFNCVVGDFTTGGQSARTVDESADRNRKSNELQLPDRLTAAHVLLDSHDSDKTEVTVFRRQKAFSQLVVEKKLHRRKGNVLICGGGSRSGV